MTNATEKLAHDAIAACGMIAPADALVYDADPMPATHRGRKSLYRGEIRDAAHVAHIADDAPIAAALYAFLAHAFTVEAGDIYSALVSRAAFGYRRRMTG